MNLKTRILSFVIASAITFSTLTATASAAGNYTIAAAALTAATSASAKVPAIKITKDSFINYTYGSLNFKSNYIWLYNFCTDKHTGLGNDMYQSADGEMYFGIHAYVRDNNLYYKFYRNCKDEFTVKRIKIISDSKETVQNVKKPMEYTKLNTAVYDNGLYKIEMSIYDVTRKRNVTASMCFYVNSGKTYLCSMSHLTKARAEKAINRRNTIAKLIKDAGITPGNSTDISDLCFPWHPTIGRNDVSNWVAMAKDIVKDEWSKELKAFAIHEWIAKNIAYDYYKKDVIKTRRASYYKDYSGKCDAYDARVGVCFDYSNIYAAMCRGVGIPAITIDTNDHTWNAVYLNGRWQEVDLTKDNMNAVYGADTTKVSSKGGIRKYSGFCTLEVNSKTPAYANYWLWTFDKAKGRK